jgi:hypothetical protein
MSVIKKSAYADIKKRELKWIVNQALSTLKYSPQASLYSTVTAYGATGNGVTDDTVAIQAALSAAGPLGRTLFFPKPTSHYKITSALSIANWHGLTIVGDGWETTEIRQYGNNTPIFQFTNDNTHSVNIEKLRLTYSTTQTYADHPNSVAIARLADGVASFSGIYHLAFRDLKIINATYGFSVIRTAPGDTTSTSPWWGTEWSRVTLVHINRTCIHLNLGSVGAPCNRFSQIKIFNSSIPNDGLSPALYLRGEAIMSEIDIEGWRNAAIQVDSANHISIRGLHIEHHYVTVSGNRLLYFANTTADIEGMVVGYDSVDTHPKYAVFAAANSVVRVRGAILNTAAGGGVSYLFSGAAAGLARVSAVGVNVTDPNAVDVSLWVNGSTFIANILSIEGLPPVLQSSDALPTAAVAYRHRQYIVPGNGSSTADRLVQCMLSAAGTYSWVDLQPV